MGSKRPMRSPVITMNMLRGVARPRALAERSAARFRTRKSQNIKTSPNLPKNTQIPAKIFRQTPKIPKLLLNLCHIDEGKLLSLFPQHPETVSLRYSQADSMEPPSRE
jgi:hypothetical protein